MARFLTGKTGPTRSSFGKYFAIVPENSKQTNLRGQVSSNAFKNFNGCIVEYLSFIGLSAKTLENLLF